MPMQPLYCTWTANGAKAHTPGSFRRGRVREVGGWINSALGELADIWVYTNDAPASDQEWARVQITCPDDVQMTHSNNGRVITLERRRPAPPRPDWPDGEPMP